MSIHRFPGNIFLQQQKLFILFLGLLAINCGCASVPPVPESARNAPPQPAAQGSGSNSDPYEGWLYESLSSKKDNAPVAQPSTSQQKPPSAVTPASVNIPATPLSAANQPASPPVTQPTNGIVQAYTPPPAAAAAGGTSIYGAKALAKGPKKEAEKKGFELSDMAPENLYKIAKKAAGYGPDEKIARQNLEEGRALFQQKNYGEAIGKFKTAADRWPDTALEEDAMFLLGESYYFSDQYPRAKDTYDELLKKHDNTRYLDTVMAREYAIGLYWQQLYQKDHLWPVVPNVTDKSRPLFDTFGYSIKSYEQIRMHDPTGPLADDSIWATANAYFVAGMYEDAAYNYDLLRKEYPTSEFQAKAHLLDLQAKLHVYQGKDYDAVPLKEADDIARQSLTQFGTQLGDEKERVARTAKEIVEKKAEREWTMGQFYEKKRYYGSARFYYQGLINDYPTTQFAQKARERLEQIRGYPDVPPNHFKWLTSLFPSEFD
jgi:outer membrane protein assembly factor BamD (BamD/ComL family)